MNVKGGQSEVGMGKYFGGGWWQEDAGGWQDCGGVAGVS